MSDNLVYVREIKKTSNPDMMNVVFEQAVAKPVTNINSLLNFANVGNPSFGNNTQKRLAFFNFSPQVIGELGFVVGQPVRGDLQCKLVVHEFCDGDIIPEEVKSYYDNQDIYKPRTWVANAGTPLEQLKTKEPKMTPKASNGSQQVLTYRGKPIYRETHFAIYEMIKADIILQHDNQIIGSTQAISSAAQRIRVGIPELG